MTSNTVEFMRALVYNGRHYLHTRQKSVPVTIVHIVTEAVLIKVAHALRLCQKGKITHFPNKPFPLKECYK